MARVCWWFKVKNIFDISYLISSFLQLRLLMYCVYSIATICMLCLWAGGRLLSGGSPTLSSWSLPTVSTSWRLHAVSINRRLLTSSISCVHLVSYCVYQLESACSVYCISLLCISTEDHLLCPAGGCLLNPWEGGLRMCLSAGGSPIISCWRLATVSIRRSPRTASLSWRPPTVSVSWRMPTVSVSWRIPTVSVSWKLILVSRAVSWRMPTVSISWRLILV